MNMFAEVVPFRPSGFANILTYKIKENSAETAETAESVESVESVEVGDIAEIAMGEKREKCIIVNILDTEPDFKTKNLGKIIAKNIYSPQDIKNICDIAEYFFTSPSHIVKKAIPANIRNTNFINTTEFVNQKKNPIVSKEIKNRIQISLGSVYSKRSTDEVEFIKKIIHDEKHTTQQVLVVFPDSITLEQTFLKYKKLFSDICVFHSGVSKKKQIEAFWKIKTGNVQIIFGTQYSLCLPFFSLSGIIVYEFAHGSHKAKFSPYTNTMQSAEIIANNNNIPLLYTSCAGDIATIYRNKNTTISRHEKIYSSQQNLHIVDMKMEHQNKNFSPLSGIAMQKIKNAIAQKKKTIIYINRKGVSHYIQCSNCGDSPVSQYTGSKMNVFKNEKNQIVLRCSAMAYAQSIEKHDFCAHCSAKMEKVGVGTQGIEELLYPLGAKILRIDGDSFHTKTAQKKMMQEIEKADIIIGTQMMLSVGSIPDCSLIVDILFENNLHFFSFTTEETAWGQIQLLQEMFERPDSSHHLEYIVQTFEPQLQLIENIKSFENFYASEILSRKILQYPPFVEYIEIECSAKTEEKVKKHIDIILHLLQGNESRVDAVEVKKVPHLQVFIASIRFFTQKGEKNIMQKLSELSIKYTVRRC